jgi:tetratricopeptide (TPR) repeat protein
MELTIEQALQQGVAAHKEGELEEAERLYRSILQSQPAHPDANHNLGILAVSVNKAGAALPLFKTALEANPKIEQFWLSYIDTLIKEKQLKSAKQAIKKAKKAGHDTKKLQALLSSQPKRAADTKAPSQEQLSSLLENYQNGRYDDAEKLAISITQKFPTNQFAWKVLGAILKQTGRISASLAASQKSVQLSPQDADAHYNLGNTLKELGRLDEAQASYTQAIALKPDYAEAYDNMGNALRELGRLGEAEASYTQAIALKPDYAEAHSNLGVTLQELGRLDEAETSYTQVIALKPDLAEAHNNLGITLQELGRLDEAETSYTQAIALKPDYAEALHNRGNCLFDNG